MSALFDNYTKSLNTTLTTPPVFNQDTVLVGGWVKWTTGQTHGSGNYAIDFTNDGASRVSIAQNSAAQALATGGWNGAASVGNSATTDGTWYLHVGLLGPNISSPTPLLGVSKDGSAIQTANGAYTSGETTNLSGLRIGQKGKSSSSFTNWKGKIAEVFVFKVASVAEANLVLDELKTKTPDMCQNGQLIWYAPLKDGVAVYVGDALTNNASVTFDAADHPSLFDGNVTIPAAPTIGTATAGVASATVEFTPPADTGGGTITGYTATSTPGAITGTGTSSPIVVEGLTPGQAYTFTVRATNSAGDSAESAASNSVVPTTPPPPPTGTITNQHDPDGQSVRFELTTTDATSGTYTLTGSNGGITVGPSPFTVTDNTADFTVTGIAPGDYSVTLTVTGGGGASAVSGTHAFSIIGVSGGGSIGGTSGGGDVTAPTLVGAITVSGIGTDGFTLSWPAGSDDTAVTGYEYSTDAGISWTDAGDVLSVAVTQLSSNTTYDVQVVAYDGAGNKSTPLQTTVTTLEVVASSFVTEPLINNTESIWANTAVVWSWLPAGRIGSLASVTATDGTGTTDADGILTVSGLPSGPGILMVAIQATDATDDSVYYEAGTVT